MAGSSPPELAIAVAEAGGMGGAGVLRDSPAGIAEWARQFRAASSGAFQLNIWTPDDAAGDAVALQQWAEQAREFLGRFGTPGEGAGARPPDHGEQLEAMLEVQPAVISSIMGLLDEDYVRRLHDRGIAWFACATTLSEALAAEAAGADAIVAQGMEAGGHRGAFDQEGERTDVGLFAMLPWFADHLRVPIVAAGGVGDGRGVAAALALGASAVQVGTALLRSPEIGIDEGWSSSLDGLAPEATVLTRAYSGRLARSAPTPYLAAWTEPGAPRPAPYPDQLRLVGQWRAAGPNGVDAVNHWAGQSAALATGDPAGEVVARMWREATELLA